MREIFDAELKQLGDDLVAMSLRVEHAISAAGDALANQDLTLAETVIADDLAIDALERDLDERCVLLLAQQQPVATDLRVVVSALRMSATLERMGDLARHVAQVARGRYPNPAITPELAAIVADTNEAARRVAARTVQVLQTHDLAVAEAIQRDDNELDALHEETFRVMLSPQWSGTAQQTVDATLIGRYYERFGDHAVSIAKRIEFLVTGEFAGEPTPNT